MRTFLFLFFITAGNNLFGQSQGVMLVDVMRIDKSRKAEALYYFENNWRVFREEAISQGVITGYQFYETESDGTLEFVLITEFKDENQYANSEANFEPILKKLRPDGPIMLNDVKPAEFRKSVSTKMAKVLWRQ